MERTIVGMMEWLELFHGVMESMSEPFPCRNGVPWDGVPWDCWEAGLVMEWNDGIV